MSLHPMLDVSAWEDCSPDPALFIADGESVTVNCYGGMLVVKDGPKGNTRERRIAKVPRVIRHMVILSTHGYVSLDAERWLADREITWAHIDRSGRTARTLAVSGGHVSPVLMRRQAYCAPGGPMEATGVGIIRRFITSKLLGQASVAEHQLGNAIAAKCIRGCLDDVAMADSISAIRGFEGQAAAAYWSAWDGLEPSWLKPAPVRPHWLKYPARHSLRRDYVTNRGATDPVNAMLNFGYHVAEIECVLSCYASALSPAMGIMHTDRPGRESFALDLIEGMRPHVDRVILDILTQPLDKRWFRVDREDLVQLAAPLTHRIVHEVHATAYHIVPDMHHVIMALSSDNNRQ